MNKDKCFCMTIEEINKSKGDYTEKCYYARLNGINENEVIVEGVDEE